MVVHFVQGSNHYDLMTDLLECQMKVSMVVVGVLKMSGSYLEVGIL
jgi:hypothetical protein